MVTLKMSNRWVIAISGTLMQVALGAVYAWSVFRKPLAEALGASTTEINLAFTTTIVMLGLAAFVGGMWLPRVGPRALGIAAGVLYGLGTYLAGYAAHNLVVLYLTYGVIAGIGLGLGYIVPIATLVKWFPKRRGLITGIAVAGFGCGALIFGPLAQALIADYGPFIAFRIIGIGFYVLVIASAAMLANPPGNAVATRRRADNVSVVYELREALKTRQWYALWLLLFLSVTAGISLIAEAAPMAQELGGATEVQAAALVGTIAIFNGAGRFVWAAFSDVVGRRAVFAMLFLVQAAVFFLLPHVRSYEAFLVLACISLFCYGGGFGTMPAFAADFFGSRNVGKVYGLMLTAWGGGALVGPILLSRIHDATGYYTGGLQAIAVIMAVGALLPLFVRRPAATVTA
jgi:OFA family oxalate/formate antiporter-like MFS transporter